MTIVELKDLITTHLKEYLPESYKHAQISFNKTLKNNNVELDTLVIANQNQRIIPNIYLNQYLIEINKGRKLVDILKEITTLYLEGIQGKTFDEIDTDFAKIKDQIVVRLVGKENNHMLMERAPYHEEGNDLLVTFRWIANQDENGLGSVLITNTLFNKWNEEAAINSEDFYEMALANTERLFPPYVTTMEDLLFGLLPDMIEFDEFVPKIGTSIPMYVITNKDKMNGATTVLYPGILDKMADKLKGDYFILPSSIHEVIVVADDEKVDVKQLQEMVKQVNHDLVDAEELLSNSVYLYDSLLKKMKKVK